MSYIVVLDKMVKNLNLRGNELLIYAMIYGFSQDGESTFSGSYQYLADMCGISKRQAINVINSLVDKGYLEKEEYTIDNQHLNRYKIKTFPDVLGGSEKISPPSEKISPPSPDFEGKKENLKKEIPLNDNSYIPKERNIQRKKEEISLSNNISLKENFLKESCTKFTPPKLEDVLKYITENGFHVNAEMFINFYESKGWFVGKNKMKNWKAAVRTWEQKYRNENKESDKDNYYDNPYHYGTKI